MASRRAPARAALSVEVAESAPNRRGAKGLWFYSLKELSMELSRVLSPAAAGIAAVLVSACSNSGSQCGVPAPVPLPIVALAFPIPGAADVDPSIAAVIVATQQGLPTPADDFLRLRSGRANGQELALRAAPSPLPSPLATTTFGPPRYLAATLNAPLASDTVYTVFLDHRPPPGTPCDGNYANQLGVFTTGPKDGAPL